MWPKDVIAINDLTRTQIVELFMLTQQMKAEPKEFAKGAEGKVLGMLFRKPSTRTRVSFDVGIYQLGGKGMLFRPDDMQLGRGETIADTAKVLSRYIDAMMIRTFDHQEVVDFAANATIPTINGLTDLSHPCQGLTDYYSVWERGIDLKGLKFTYLGDGNNVAHSLIQGAARLGVHLTIGCPAGHEPDSDILAEGQNGAAMTGGSITISNDPVSAVTGARVVYTDVWASMGQKDESEARHERFKPFQVTVKLLTNAAPDWLFMHCLPAHRGEEVTSAVCDHEQSIIFDQAENRLHVQKGILYNLLAR
jgi:ornithine carbamoyltransferase